MKTTMGSVDLYDSMPLGLDSTKQEYSRNPDTSVKTLTVGTPSGCTKKLSSVKTLDLDSLPTKHSKLHQSHKLHMIPENNASLDIGAYPDIDPMVGQKSSSVVSNM